MVLLKADVAGNAATGSKVALPAQRSRRAANCTLFGRLALTVSNRFDR